MFLKFHHSEKLETHCRNINKKIITAQKCKDSEVGTFTIQKLSSGILAGLSPQFFPQLWKKLIFFTSAKKAVREGLGTRLVEPLLKNYLK